MDRGVLGGEGDRIWRGGIAIEMEGDRDRVSMKFKNIHDSSKSAHEIQSRNEGYNLNTIDLSLLSVHNLLALIFRKWSSSLERTSFR